VFTWGWGGGREFLMTTPCLLRFHCSGRKFLVGLVTRSTFAPSRAGHLEKWNAFFFLFIFPGSSTEYQGKKRLKIIIIKIIEEKKSLLGITYYYQCLLFFLLLFHFFNFMI
jgi:hypothetical protein